MKNKNKLGVLLVFMALLLFTIGFYTYFEKESRSPKEQIVQMWFEDLTNLAPELPKSWSKIKEVSLAYGDQETHVFFTDLDRAPVKVSPQGEYRLEIIIISEDQKHFIFQHNMVHIPTGEMLWELDRSYQVKP